MTKQYGLKSALAWVCLLAVLIGLMLLATSGPGHRAGIWHFRSGFMLMRTAVWILGAGAALGLLGLIVHALKGGSRFNLVCFVLTVVIGGGTVGLAMKKMSEAQTLPRIHDISTDTDTPPQFVEILPLRKDAPNPAEYGGTEIAAQQIQAYPDIKPLILNLSAEEAFDRALKAAKDMGWEIVSYEKPSRIEATDTTFWYGFKDDIVIRIQPNDEGSRIDARSVSRVGLSDVGTNAKRIRKYLARLK